VTAAQGDKKFTAISSEQGSYSFANLPDGVWTVQVEMLCFSPVKQEVTVAPDARASEWDLKLLPFEEIKAAAGPVASAISAPKNAQSGFKRTDVNAAPSNASSDAGKLADDTGDFSKSASDVFSINGSVNNAAASPFAQSQAFGNNRRGGRSLYNAGIGVFLDNSFFGRPFVFLDRPGHAQAGLQSPARHGGVRRSAADSAFSARKQPQFLRRLPVDAEPKCQHGIQPDADLG
jgi:hypothetical protein